MATSSVIIGPIEGTAFMQGSEAQPYPIIKLRNTGGVAEPEGLGGLIMEAFHSLMATKDSPLAEVTLLDQVCSMFVWWPVS